MQCDLWEPREQIPVGHGQTRRGWVVTAELCWSRAFAGTLVFSKEAPDILWGLARNLGRIGALPEKLVWDREAAIARAGARPRRSPRSAGSWRSAGSSSMRGDPQAKGQLERSHRFMRTNFEPGRRVREPARLPGPARRLGEKANGRVHRTIRAVPAERLAEERERMRPLPARCRTLDRRLVIAGCRSSRIVRVDRNDYSIDPAFAGRRVEVRVSQSEITAVVLDTGELALPASARRSLAALTFTDPAHQSELERQRERRRQRHEVEVEIRPLSRYDAADPGMTKPRRARAPVPRAESTGRGQGAAGAR